MAIISGGMTNTVTYNNASSTDRTLALRVYAGEVTRAFRRRNIMAALHMRKDMASGKSMQFPAAGRMSASFHVKGNNILTDGTAGVGGSASRLNFVERHVYIDNILVAATFIPELDELLEHYDSRSVAADEAGEALAYYYDQLAIQQVVRAARTNSTSDVNFIPTDMGDSSGDSTGVGGFVTSAFATAANIIAAGEDAAQTLDEKYVPDEDRHWPMSPASYWTLINSDKVISVDYSPGNGHYAAGKMYMAGGATIHKTNHYPTSRWWTASPIAVTGATGQPDGAVNDYYGNFTTVKSVFFHRSAIASVWLMDVTLEMEHLIEYLGTPCLAKMLAGTGRLRPEAAVEINTASTQPNLAGTT